MILTLNALFNDAVIVSAIIDRVNQTEKDTIYWKKYLKFEQSKSRLFKTYLGTITGVTMGSVIDRNSGKPTRERKTLGSGVGEVAFMGNSFQLDNDRLDTLNELISKFNGAGNGQAVVMTEIIEYIADDIRQATLAPHKRMDFILGQLRSTGTASVKVGDNAQGVELLDMVLPVIHLKPEAGVKSNLINYIKEKVEELRYTVGVFSVMEMNRKTFNNRIANTSSFQNAYKMILGSAEIAVSGGLITDAMANSLLIGIGLPAIQIVEEYVTKEDGSVVCTFADDRISLLPSQDLGKMMWHTPYESTDPIPTKSYTTLEGGQFISTQRTEEGRFVEYGCEWIPNLTNPNKIVIIDTSLLV
jgi:hypothetical protein